VPNYHETYRKYTVSVEEHIDYMKFDLGSNLVTSVKVKGHFLAHFAQIHKINSHSLNNCPNGTKVDDEVGPLSIALCP